MKYVNILLIGLVLLFPGCTFLDVVPEGNIESIESTKRRIGSSIVISGSVRLPLP
mgnify:CR=1 FL=1